MTERVYLLSFKTLALQENVFVLLDKLLDEEKAMKNT